MLVGVGVRGCESTGSVRQEALGPLSAGLGRSCLEPQGEAEGTPPLHIALLGRAGTEHEVEVDATQGRTF